MNDLEHLYVSSEQSSLEASRPLTAADPWWTNLAEETAVIRARNDAHDDRQKQLEARQQAAQAKIDRELAGKARPHKYAHVKSVIGATSSPHKRAETPAALDITLPTAGTTTTATTVANTPAADSKHSRSSAPGDGPLLSPAIQQSYSQVAFKRLYDAAEVAANMEPIEPPPPISPTTAAAMLGPTKHKQHPMKMAANPGLASIRSTGIVTPSPDQVNPALPTSKAFTFVLSSPVERTMNDALPPSQKAMRMRDALAVAAHATVAAHRRRKSGELATARERDDTSDEEKDSSDAAPEGASSTVSAVAASPASPATQPLTKSQQTQFDKAHRAILAEFPFLDRTGTSLPPRNLSSPPDIRVSTAPSAADVTRVIGVRGDNCRRIYTRQMVAPDDDGIDDPNLDEPHTGNKEKHDASRSSSPQPARTMKLSASMPSLPRHSIVNALSSRPTTSSGASTSAQSDVIPPVPSPGPHQPATILWEFRDLGTTDHVVRRTVFENPEAVRAQMNHRRMVEEVLARQQALAAARTSTAAATKVAAQETFKLHPNLLQNESVASSFGAPVNTTEPVAAPTTLLPAASLSTLLGADLSSSLDLNSREGRETLAELRFLQGQQIELLGDEQGEFKSRMMRDFFIREAHARISAQGAVHTAAIVRECAMALRVHLRYKKHQHAVMASDALRSQTEHHAWVTREAEARAENRARERRAKRDAAAANKVKQFAIHTGQHLLAAEAHSEELKNHRIAMQAVKTRFALYQGAHSVDDDSEMRAAQQVPHNRTQRRIEPPSTLRAVQPRSPLHDPTPMLNEFEPPRADIPPGHPAYVFTSSFRPPAHPLEKLLATPAKHEQQTAAIFRNVKNQQYKERAARDAAKVQANKADRRREQAEERLAEQTAAGERPDTPSSRPASPSSRRTASSSSFLTIAADDPDSPSAFVPSRPDLGREDLTRERLQWVRVEEAKKGRLALREKRAREKARREQLRVARAGEQEANDESELAQLGRRIDGALAAANVQDASDQGLSHAEREKRAMAAIEAEVRAKMRIREEVAAGRARIDHRGEVVPVAPPATAAAAATNAADSDNDVFSAAFKNIGAAAPPPKSAPPRQATVQLDLTATEPTLLMRELEIVKYSLPIGTERERRIKARIQAELEAEVAELSHNPLGFLNSLLPPTPISSRRTTARSPKVQAPQPRWGMGQSSSRASFAMPSAGGSLRPPRGSILGGGSPISTRGTSRSPSKANSPNTPSRRFSHQVGESSRGPPNAGGSTTRRFSSMESARGFQSPPPSSFRATSSDSVGSAISPPTAFSTPESSPTPKWPSDASGVGADSRPRLTHSQSALMPREVEHLEVQREVHTADLAFAIELASDAIAEIEEEEEANLEEVEDELDARTRAVPFTITTTDADTADARPTSPMPPENNTRGRPTPIVIKPSKQQMLASASAPTLMPRSESPHRLPDSPGTPASPMRPKTLTSSPHHTGHSGPPTARLTLDMDSPQSGKTPLSSSKSPSNKQTLSLTIQPASAPVATPRAKRANSVAVPSVARPATAGRKSMSAVRHSVQLTSPPAPAKAHRRVSSFRVKLDPDWTPELDARGYPLSRAGAMIRPLHLAMALNSLHHAVPRVSPLLHTLEAPLARAWFSGLNIEHDPETDAEDARLLAKHAREVALQQELDAPIRRMAMPRHASTLVSSPTPIYGQRELMVRDKEARTERDYAGDLTSRQQQSTPPPVHNQTWQSPSQQSPEPQTMSVSFADVSGLLQAKKKTAGGLRGLKSQWKKVDSRLMDVTASSLSRSASINALYSPDASTGASSTRLTLRSSSPFSPGRVNDLSSQRSDFSSEGMSGRTLSTSRSARALAASMSASLPNPFYTSDELPLSNNIALKESKWERSKYHEKPTLMQQLAAGRSVSAGSPTKRRPGSSSMSSLHGVAADKTLDLHDPLHSPELRRMRATHATRLVQYASPDDGDDGVVSDRAGKNLDVFAAKKGGPAARKDTSLVNSVTARALTPRTLARQKIYLSRNSAKVNPLSDYALRQWLTAHRKIYKATTVPQEASGRHGVLFREISKPDSPFKAPAADAIDMRDVLGKMFSRTGLHALAAPQLRHLEKMFLAHFAGGVKMSERERAMQQRGPASMRALAHQGGHEGNFSITQFVQRFLTSDLAEWSKWWTTQQELAQMAMGKTDGDAKVAAESLPRESAILPLPLWVPAYHRLKILDRLMSHTAEKEEQTFTGMTEVADLDLADLWTATQAEVHERLVEFNDASSKALETITREEEDKFADKLHRLFNSQLLDMMDVDREQKLDEQEEEEESMVEATHEEAMRIALQAYHQTPAGKVLMRQEAAYAAAGLLQTPIDPLSPVRTTGSSVASPSNERSVSTPRLYATGKQQLSPLPDRPNSGVAIRTSATSNNGRQSVAAAMLEASDPAERKAARLKEMQAKQEALNPPSPTTPMSAGRRRLLAAQQATLAKVQQTTRTPGQRSLDRMFSAVKILTSTQTAKSPDANSAAPSTPNTNRSHLSALRSESASPGGSPKAESGTPARVTFDVFAAIRPATLAASQMHHEAAAAAELAAAEAARIAEMAPAEEEEMDIDSDISIDDAVSELEVTAAPTVSTSSTAQPTESASQKPMHLRVQIQPEANVVTKVDAATKIVTITSAPEPATKTSPNVPRVPALESPSGLSRPKKSMKGIRRRNLKQLRAEERRRIDAKEVLGVEEAAPVNRERRSSLTRPLNAAARLLPKPKYRSVGQDGRTPGVYLIDPREEIPAAVDLKAITWSELQAAIETCSQVHEAELDEEEQRRAEAEAVSEDEDSEQTVDALEAMVLEHQAALDVGLPAVPPTDSGGGITKLIPEIESVPVETREEEAARELQKLGHRKLHSGNFRLSNADLTAIALAVAPMTQPRRSVGLPSHPPRHPKSRAVTDGQPESSHMVSPPFDVSGFTTPGTASTSASQTPMRLSSPLHSRSASSVAFDTAASTPPLAESMPNTQNTTPRQSVAMTPSRTSSAGQGKLPTTTNNNDTSDDVASTKADIADAQSHPTAGEASVPQPESQPSPSLAPLATDTQSTSLSPLPPVTPVLVSSAASSPLADEEPARWEKSPEFDWDF